MGLGKPAKACARKQPWLVCRGRCPGLDRFCLLLVFFVVVVGAGLQESEA